MFNLNDTALKGKGRYGQFIRWIFSGIDFLILNIIYLVVCWFEPANGMFFSKQVWMLLNLSYFVVAYFFSDIHERRVVYADQVLMQVVKAVMLHAVIFLSLIYFLDYDSVSWRTRVKISVAAVAVMSLWWIFSRRLLKMYRTSGYNYKRIVVIGSGNVAHRLMEELASDLGYGYRIEGVFDNSDKGRNMKNYKGNLNDLEPFLKDNLIDEMYCAIPDADNDEVHRLMKMAERNAVDFFYIPQLGRYITRRFELYSLGNIPILSVRPYPLSNPFNALLKRTFDLLMSLIALILSPIILIPVAIAIKVTSPGPIFFKQERTGLRGEPFVCYKFRTMRVNSDSDTKQATKNDPRKTRLGNFLRKTSIDELPQFWNVLKGEMSVVGPRPHMTKHTEAYSALIDKYMLRHTIKPGITGWAQVNGYRGQTDELWKMEKRVEYDVWYAENWNFMLDIKIIFLTIYKAIFGDKNAF